MSHIADHSPDLWCWVGLLVIVVAPVLESSVFLGRFTAVLPARVVVVPVGAAAHGARQGTLHREEIEGFGRRPSDRR